MKLINRKGLRTWIEIDTKAISHNYKLLRGIVPRDTKIMSIVKSNAYGHNLTDFALEGQKLGVDWFGVDSIVEAISLRNSGVTKPILVLGYTLPEMLKKVIKYDVSIAVSTFELLDIISSKSFAKKTKVHIKIDTGMHRQGFQEHEIEKVIEKLKSLESKIKVEGIFTHFAGIKNSKFSNLTDKQLKSFKSCLKEFKEAGFSPIAHAGASGAIFTFSQAHFYMVRIGIAQYGLWPSEEVKKFSKSKKELKPILEWKTIIGEIKDLQKGSRVGYDFSEKLKKDSVIAICPVGYWHGYPRNLSSKGCVLVKGNRAKILGRISMDMIVIDITKITEVKVGDVVTLIGSDGKETISAEEIADLSRTSAYEIITRINPLIKRIYF